MITFVNKTNISIYDNFIRQWKDKINESLLTNKEFDIHIVTLNQFLETYHYLNVTNENFEDSPYGCIYDGGFEGKTNNVIIVNDKFVDRLNLLESEIMASLLHEVGHLYYYLEYSRIAGNNVTIKELMSDCFAKKLGMGDELKNALIKMSNSGLYSKEYCERAIDWRRDRLD